MVLRGKPFYMGGDAYRPDTGERCRKNHYGGYVCSEACDRGSSQRLEDSMPGAGRAGGRLSDFARQSLNRNWSEPK
jgi:hypothetical protein